MASERRYNNVLDIIDKRLIPNEAAKKARGEVFTPLNLVREMLYGLRKSALSEGKTEVWGVDNTGRCIEDDPANRVGGIPLDVWRDPDTKWLDPANGIGNFPVVTFYMLDHQLGHHGPSKYRGEANKKDRRKHIIEKMLFMIEINKGNVNTSRKIFDQIVPGATANICCADTLSMTDDKLKEVFGVNRFDVVMGNPPFNDNLQDNPVGHAQDTGLWGEFVKISFLHFLKDDNSFLSFLHPARWRQPNHSLHDVLFSKQFIFLSIFNKKSGSDYFKAITRFDYYVIQNKLSTLPAIIKFEDNTIATININKTTPFIPNFGYDIWEKILSKKLDSLKVLGGGGITYSQTDRIIDGKCPLAKPFKNVNTTAKTSRTPPGALYTKTKVDAEGEIIFVDIVCSSSEHKLLKTPKVIFSKNEVVYAFFDKGEFGLTSNAFCILVESASHGKKIVKFLHSHLIKYLIASVKFGNFSTAKNIFDYIPNPIFLEGEYSSEDIYDYFKFSKDQQHKLESRNYIDEEVEERAPRNKTEKKKKTLSTVAEGGFRSSKYGKTRKVRRMRF